MCIFVDKQRWTNKRIEERQKWISIISVLFLANIFLVLIRNLELHYSEPEKNWRYMFNPPIKQKKSSIVISLSWLLTKQKTNLRKRKKLKGNEQQLANYQFAGKLELTTLLVAIAGVIAIGDTAVLVVCGRCDSSSIVSTTIVWLLRISNKGSDGCC